MTMEHLDRSFAITLFVKHPSMHPLVVTQALGLMPSNSCPAGPPRKAPFDWACWSYAFDCAGTRHLFPLLDQIADQLEPHRDFLLSVGESGGGVELFCGIMVDFNWDEVLPFRLMGRLSSLGIDLRLDAYPEHRKSSETSPGA
jgi:hypothetical protein